MINSLQSEDQCTRRAAHVALVVDVRVGKASVPWGSRQKNAHQGDRAANMNAHECYPKKRSHRAVISSS